MTFQGCCQPYCYSKDPFMNSIKVRQVEGLFSLPVASFFHDQIVMTMGLSVMLSPVKPIFFPDKVCINL